MDESELKEEDALFILASLCSLDLEELNKLVDKCNNEPSSSPSSCSSYIPLEASLPRYPKKLRSALLNKKEKETVSFDDGKEWVGKLSSMEPRPLPFKKGNFFVGESSRRNSIDHEEEERMLKKRKLATIVEDKEEEKRYKKKTVPEKKKKKATIDGPNPPPRMPQEIRNAISMFVRGDRAISMEKLVLQRKLEKSDCDKGQHRFSLPKGKVLEEYLEKNEEGIKLLDVKVIDPSLKQYEMKLSKWNPKKPFRVLNSPSWQTIVKTNRLCPGMIMQLWAVRVGRELWFVLVNVTPPTQNLSVETTTVAANGNDGATHEAGEEAANGKDDGTTHEGGEEAVITDSDYGGYNRSGESSDGYDYYLNCD